MPFVNNNPSGFGVTSPPSSGSNRVGLNRGTSINIPDAAPSSSSNAFIKTPSFTQSVKVPPFVQVNSAPPFVQVNKPPTINTPPSPIGKGFSLPPVLGVAGMVLGRGYMLLDTIPTFQGVGDGLGYLWNLPQNIGNAFEKRRLDHLLKQREAQAIDRARINNASKATITPPPFTGGQSTGVAYSLLLGAEYTDNSGTFQVRWLLSGTRRFTAFNGEFTDAQIRGVGSLAGAISSSDITLEGQVVTIRGAFGFDAGLPDLKNFRIIKVLTTDGQPDTGGNLPTQTTYDNPPPVPPPYPNRDTWLYGSKDVQSPYGIQELSRKSWQEQAVKPFPQPSIKPFERSSAVTPFKEPDKQIDVAQPDTSKNPSIAKSPSGFNFVPSNQTVNNNRVVNNNFIGSNNSPSPQPQQQAKPKDSPTPDVFEQAKADFDKYYSVGYGMFNTSGVQGIVAGVNSSYGAKPSDANGAKAFIAVKQKEAQVYDKPTQTTPNKPTVTPDKRSPNTTPTTPTTSNPNDSNFATTIASLIGLTALVTAMKLGSDAFVSASLPKINNINNNTSPQAQQTNAKQGVCDAMQPQQCGFEGVKAATTEATNPIKAQTVANAGLLGNVLSAIANLASTIANLFSNVVGKLDGIKEFLDKVWSNQVVDKVMQFITMITVIHNATMLTRGIADTLGSAIDQGLQVFGLQLKDKEGNQIGVSTVIGQSVQNLIKSIVGADNYTALNQTWLQANRVYQTGINLISNIQSIVDSSTAVAELTNNRLGTLMNALRNSGAVRENAYGAQSQNVTKFNAFQNRLENLEQGVSNVASITGNIASVQQSVNELKTNRQEFENSLKDKPVGTGLTENEAEKTARGEKKEQSVYTIGDFSVVKPPETP